jgi:hypothetical protein
VIIIIKPRRVPPKKQTPDAPPADGNGTTPPDPVPGNNTTEPPVPEIPDNDTGDRTDGNGINEPPTNLTDPNGTDIGGNRSGAVHLTPPGGAPLLGDRYQTPPRETPEQPPDVERVGILDRILLFLRGIIAAILNWFARLGTL